MTQTHDDYLFERYQHKIKRENKIVGVWQLIILIGFFGMWETAGRLYWIDPLLFSTPSQVASVIAQKVVDGSLIHHLEVTVLETVLGFILGTIIGIILATLLWSSVRLSRIMDPFLVIANAMPKVALGPIIIVAMGPGYTSIITMGVIVSVIITTIVVYSGFKEVDPNYVKVLQGFGATRWQCFKEAIFPATLPTMISCLKVNVGLSWVGIVVGEFLVSKEGLGYLIIYGFQVFDFTLVMSSLFLIAIFAAAMYKIVEKLEGKLIKHTS